MHDANHALARLRDISGLTTLEWSADGHVELIVDEAIALTLAKVDDTTMELVADLGREIPEDPVAFLRILLRANYLGEATGGARIALDPSDDTPVLCRRIEVALHDDRSLEAAFLDFVRHAAFWRSPAADAVFVKGADAPGHLPPLHDEASLPGLTIFRV